MEGTLQDLLSTCLFTGQCSITRVARHAHCAGWQPPPAASTPAYGLPYGCQTGMSWMMSLQGLHVTKAL